MPIYDYTARDIEGHSHKGVIDATSEREAREMLRRRQLYTTDLRAQRQKGSGTWVWAVVMAVIGVVLFVLWRALATPGVTTAAP